MIYQVNEEEISIVVINEYKILFTLKENQEKSQTKFNNYYINKDFNYYQSRLKDEIVEYFVEIIFIIAFEIKVKKY